MKRKICVATGTRADYGILSLLMQAIKSHPDLQLQIIATNMHLSPEYGCTYQEIEKDGFIIDKKVEMLVSGNTATATAKSLGLGIIGFTDALNELKPDILVILGDRYEMLGMASAALLLRIPIAHISGGDVTEGAFDDAIRHSITKMSSLHFTSTETYRKRVIQLGEEPQYVFNVGSLSIDNMKRIQLMNKSEFEAAIDFKLAPHNALVTFHPETVNPSSSEKHFGNLLKCLETFPGNIIFTKPNSDTGSQAISQMIDRYTASHTNTSKAFVSLGYLRYLSALQFMDVVIGNSSSGLLEVPSFHIPTINIGNRQKGRLHGESVIDCDTSVQGIQNALQGALSPGFQKKAADARNPYEKENTIATILDILLKTPTEVLHRQKKFNNIAL